MVVVDFHEEVEQLAIKFETSGVGATGFPAITNWRATYIGVKGTGQPEAKGQVKYQMGKMFFDTLS